ncbi:c-type cytochrome biogenesis protein CcmI [Pararhodobacter sp. SW119]|uniref:c-type cytochrome biogenesis protein CcmI n=1 Tax=Pararhodobacter sp. SW119 TaxID=2780075 RepID=UPI001AE08075|nr:c-type cytochrome biogenesis protein CcmI [Pararhodobacter sp. SW119]
MDLWLFLLPAAVIVLIVATLIALGFLRGAEARAGTSTAPAPKREMQVYAAQLREIERDLTRGTVTPEEAERLRTEIGRRLLDADRAKRVDIGRAPPSMRTLGLALIPAVAILAAVLYWREGAPGYPDLPLAQRHAEATEMRAARPSQAELAAEWAANPQRPQPGEPDAEFAALLERLREALQTRPLDVEGHRLLARNEANIGNIAAAAEAQAQVVALQGDEAPVPDLVLLAEFQVIAAGGVVSPESEQVLERILRRDPTNGLARYYTGLMFAQTGRPDLTFRLWRGLLDDSRPDAPWVPHLRATLPELAEVAGVRYTLPPAQATGARGPSSADMQAAMDLDPEERAAMIGGMVEGLAARLAASGGPAEDWARLIAALGVLGEQDRARAIWAEAQRLFADQTEGLAQIQAAARGAGVAN